MLYVNGLYKTFVDDSSTVNALQDINMHIEPNEFAVIVGPSGCGKTTLLNIAAGLENATQGTISLNGNIITGPGPDRGMVFQSYTLFPWLYLEKIDAFCFGLVGRFSMDLESLVVNLHLGSLAHSGAKCSFWSSATAAEPDGDREYS